MKKTALTLIVATGILVGCGSSTTEVETGVAATVACLKDGGATNIQPDKTWPYTTISAEGSNRNLLMLTTTGLANPRFPGVKQSITGSVPGSRFEETEDGRVLVAVSPTTPSEDMDLALDCASRLAIPSNAPEKKAARPPADFDPQQMAVIEKACGMEAGTAEQALKKLYGNGPKVVIDAAERLATDLPKQFCPTLTP